jgi:hypothetical protein
MLGGFKNQTQCKTLGNCISDLIVDNNDILLVTIICKKDADDDPQQR